MGFKEGDEVFIRWDNGHCGGYTLIEESGKLYASDGFGGRAKGKSSGEVFMDTERVELLP